MLLLSLLPLRAPNPLPPTLPLFSFKFEILDSVGLFTSCCLYSIALIAGDLRATIICPCLFAINSSNFSGATLTILENISSLSSISVLSLKSFPFELVELLTVLSMFKLFKLFNPPLKLFNEFRLFVVLMLLILLDPFIVFSIRLLFSKNKFISSDCL